MDECVSLNRDYLKGRRFCATGRLVTMTHANLADLVQSCGGTYVKHPPRGSIVIVIGGGGWPTESNGAPSRLIQRAQALKAYGYTVEFTPEDDFLANLGLNDSANAIRGQHTLTDLARILDVSPLRLRRWVRRGIIEPTRTTHHVAFFDFHHVAFTKHLCDLLEAGASLDAIQTGLAQIRSILPPGDPSFRYRATIRRDGRFLVRLRNRLVDYRGQMYFDFDGGDATEPAVSSSEFATSVHDLCDRALELEDCGRLAEAADFYRKALDLDSRNAVLHFDLGNVMFQMDKVEDSIRCFNNSLECDPNSAMAWHNLGCAYASIGRHRESEDALRYALRLVPTYADSHNTLADVLAILGRTEEAEAHRDAFRRHSAANRVIASREQLLRIVHVGEEARTIS